MILNTVPAWKKAYKVRVVVFVEYESDVEEERGRVESLLENLRINAEVLVFWLSSGSLKTYEIIVNGASVGADIEEEVEQCLEGQEWWDEIQKFRGKRGEATATEDLADIASIFTSGSAWPESSFQQGPRDERVERFLGLRRLLRKSRRKHTMSGLTKLGVSLGMRTNKLSPNLVRHHVSQESASEASGSDSETDSEAMESDSGPASAASEADVDDFESDDNSPPRNVTIRRRKSHGDSMGGPPPSKKSTGEREVKVPERTSKKDWFVSTSDQAPTSAPDLRLGEASTPTKKAAPSSTLSAALKLTLASSSLGDKPSSIRSLAQPGLRPEDRLPGRPSSALSDRPALSRHASQPKFSSKPVPVTRVATEDGPGPSIMFQDTPSPPPRRGRLTSAYRPTESSPLLLGGSTEVHDDHKSRNGSNNQSAPNSRRGSTYSTQGIPISFNDLPCRAQHLILNELMRKESDDTAVMFTTLPSPVEGTSKSQEASAAYLADLEVLCKGCPPVLLVHSNSMTVTMSL